MIGPGYCVVSVTSLCHVAPNSVFLDDHGITKRDLGKFFPESSLPTNVSAVITNGAAYTHNDKVFSSKLSQVILNTMSPQSNLIKLLDLSLKPTHVTSLHICRSPSYLCN